MVFFASLAFAGEWTIVIRNRARFVSSSSWYRKYFTRDQEKDKEPMIGNHFSPTKDVKRILIANSLMIIITKIESFNPKKIFYLGSIRKNYYIVIKD